MGALKKYLLLFLCGACLQLDAQEAVALSHYVFEQFAPGSVQQKNGSVSEAKLNYNVLSGEMIFESAPGQYMALANPQHSLPRH